MGQRAAPGAWQRKDDRQWRLPPHCTRPLRRCLATAWMLLLVSTSHTLCCYRSTAGAATTTSAATSSSSARYQAIRDLPLDRLTPAARQKILQVVQNPSMYRRLPLTVIDCDPQLHQFLVRHPETIVNIWQLMGITKVTLERTGDYTLSGSDGNGTTTSIELVYGTHDTHLFYCEGHYDGPLFPRPATGRCVVLLKSQIVARGNSEWQITNRMDAFLQVDNVTLDVFTRTVHPLLGHTADVNFVESMRFVQRVSATAEANGPGMQRLARRLTRVSPDIRGRFEELCSDVYRQATRRLASASK